MYYLYFIQNLVNNKIYIGKAKIRRYNRFYEHIRIAIGGPNKYKNTFSLIHKAIRKYGVYTFNYVEFQRFGKEKDALLAEKYWIKYYNSNNSQFGYNLTEGGDGVSGRKVSKETRLKISKALKGRKPSEKCINNSKLWYANNRGKIKRKGNVNTKIKWIDNDELILLVRSVGFRGAGKILGVSDGAVRGRLKRRGLLSAELINFCKHRKFKK